VALWLAYRGHTVRRLELPGGSRGRGGVGTRLGRFAVIIAVVNPDAGTTPAIRKHLARSRALSLEMRRSGDGVVRSLRRASEALRQRSRANDNGRP
jgi:hypothetical protein